MTDPHPSQPSPRPDRPARAPAPPEVLIIGGGIVGAGVARDAAMRGLSVWLVEQQDFAEGTSSRSSRLLHGGLRYLAQGRVGLVREASREKCILGRIAPHLAQPLPFVFPSYRGAGWPLWKLHLGVKLYDRLCGGENFGRSARLGRRRLRRALPSLETRGLGGGVRYFDALTQDARLVMDTLRSAERAGAGVFNHCRLVEARPVQGRWRCRLRDRLDGGDHDVEVPVVINAAGPWADRIPGSAVRIRMTKGVHVVLDRDRLPLEEALVSPDGRRILFAIPWGRRMILGTTDTEYHGRPGAVRTSAWDVDQVLGVFSRVFPDRRLNRSDVVSHWAGVRPLIDAGGGGPSEISRGHQIRSPASGWWDVAGGKLTTHRLMAEQTVDAVAAHLGQSLAPCPTATQPLIPADEAERVSGILPRPPSRTLVEHYCRSEWAVHLTDVMIRRSSWHHERQDRRTLAECVSGWMALCLGWDPARRQAELDDYRRQVEEEERILEPDGSGPGSVSDQALHAEDEPISYQTR